MKQVFFTPSSPIPYEIREVTITPALAAEMLAGERNKQNRAMKQQNIRAYARQMISGDWMVPAAPLLFADDADGYNDRLGREGFGSLVDGQNRLQAIIHADVEQRVVVILGVPFETQDVTDVGATRTLGDMLRIRGVSSYTATAALTWEVWGMETQPESIQRFGAGKAVVPKIELLRFFEKFAPGVYDENHPIVRTANAGQRLNASFPAMTPKDYGKILWLIDHIETDEPDRRDADRDYFFNRLTTGAGLAEGSPILLLRSKLIDQIMAASQKKPVELPKVRAAWIIKAWNAFREGRPVRVLSYRPGGEKPEPFPMPI